MKERPILMSAPLVRAILAGTKSQTRRVIKPQPAALCRYEMNASGNAALHLGPPLKPGDGFSFVPPTPRSKDHRLPCPYGAPGDRLWVKETWQPEYVAGWEHLGPVRYRATQDERVMGHRWRPGIHLPRWASRITLEVTGVRVERLQAITEEDAKAEGATPYVYGYGFITELGIAADPGIRTPSMYRAGFEQLWRGINGDESWAANVWVWVVSFRRVEAEEH